MAPDHSIVRPTPSNAAATERIRAICTALPLVSERLSHGEATWFVNGKKSFASMSDRHHGSRIFICVAAAVGVQESLVGSEPDRYMRPPYVGGRGWVGAYLDGSDAASAPDWDMIESLVTDAWLLIAPAKLRSLIDTP
ncbi:MAG TPA: MmcQ/YjbR family DNA-binding protein [Acidimicrobiales bacterium]